MNDESLTTNTKEKPVLQVSIPPAVASAELAEVVSILSERQKPALAEAAFFFNPRAGHRLVLAAEFDELLGFADAVELKLAGTTGLAFVVAIRLRHRESEWASDWVRCLYVPSRDPARPRPLDVKEGWQLPLSACRLELAVDGKPGGVRRSCVVPAEFGAHLNARVRRAVGADSFIGQLRQTLYILGRITADQIDQLATHESAVVELSKA